MTQECALDTEGFCDYIVIIINCLSLLLCEERRQGLLFSHSVMSHSATPWTAAHQASLSFPISQSLLNLMRIELMMPFNHLILCFHPLLLMLSIFPSIRVFSDDLVLCIRWPKYWGFSFSMSPSNEYSGLISFRIDCFDLLAVQESSPIPLFESTISLGLSFLYPLQCSCLENPRDGGAWWAAVSGVAQSRTQLKRLSSSSSFLYSITLTSIHD